MQKYCFIRSANVWWPELQSQVSNYNCNRETEHRQHKIHIPAGMMTIMWHTNQPNLTQTQCTIRDIQWIRSDAMDTDGYNHTNYRYLLFLFFDQYPSISHTWHIQTNRIDTADIPTRYRMNGQVNSLPIPYTLIPYSWFILCIDGQTRLNDAHRSVSNV